MHLIHSLDPQGGGVSEAVVRLDSELNKCGKKSSILSDRLSVPEKCSAVLAHGLWQWPSYMAWKNFRENGTPYLVFPHGMLDPWFKKTYPLKHIKKQIYWWYRQGAILRDAYAVCFTTKEERLLAQKTFSPFQCREIVTGLGVGNPPGDLEKQSTLLYSQFPQLKNNRAYLSTGDTPISKDSNLVAKLAVGAGLEAVDQIMAGDLSSAFALVRPPGHHASSSMGMGFCVYNSIAVVARY